MGTVKYTGALPANSYPSEKYGTNIVFNNGVAEKCGDLDLLQRLEKNSDFEVRYTAEEVAKIAVGKSVSELKKWLTVSRVSDTRHLSTKKEVLDELKKVKTT